jgi:hypothetical protein
MVELLLLWSRLAAWLGFSAQAEDYRRAAAYIRGVQLERKRRLYV